MLDFIRESTKGETWREALSTGPGITRGARTVFKTVSAKVPVWALSVPFVVVGTIYLGKLGISKLKDVAAARHEKKLQSMEQLETPPASDDNDGDVNP